MPIQIPLTQTAVVFEKHGGPLLVKQDWPVVQPKDLKPGEALVKLFYSGVCGTDYHAYKGEWPAEAKLPLVGGHEGVGEIVAIGAGTNSTRKIGDLVGIKWLADSCLDCEACREGQEATCAQAKTSGYSNDGSFQQYAVSFTRHLTPIPAGLDLAQAAPLLCAGVTVWKAIKQSNTKPGDWILISGAGGGLGHLCIQYALALSLRVIAIDTGVSKKALVQSYSPDIVFLDFKDSGNLVDRVKEAAGGLGPHAAIVASGEGEAYTQALDYLRPHGTLVAVGLPGKAVIEASVFWTVFKALRIVGSYVGNRQDAIEALDFGARNLVKARITVEPLVNLESVYDRLSKGEISGRVVLKCS